MRSSPSSVFAAAAVVAATLLLPAVALGARRAGAGESPAAGVGVVVRVSDVEVFVDLGRRAGAAPHDRVQLLRRIEVTHPVTRRTIVDWFLLGVVELTDVGDELAFARLSEEAPLDHPPKVGDMARLVSTRTAAGVAAGLAATTGAPPGRAGVGEATECAPCREDPEALAVHEAWLLGLGKPLEERLDVWAAFLLTRPESPYVDRVRGEIRWLEELREWSRHIPAAPTSIVVTHRAPAAIEVGGPFAAAFTVTEPESVQRVTVYTRGPDDVDYHASLCTRTGDYTWSVDLPPDRLQGPSLEYFAEVFDTSGAVAASWREAALPLLVPLVEPAEVVPNRTGRSRARTRFDYVDFYLTDAWLDSYWQFEADFTYRIGTWLDSVRVGAGIISGRGGPKERIVLANDDPAYLAPRTLTTSYAYLELEFRLWRWVSLLARGMGGSLRASSDRENVGETVLGFRTAVRLGWPDQTNLLLHYTVSQALGMEGGVDLRVDVFRNFPLGGQVIVTNFPVGEDLGVRIVAQAGWSGLDWFEIALRVGYDIRDINHSGASVGLDLAFDW